MKSGLPESFKKQIAKTAASREAYSQACASFQTVFHVQQRAAGKIKGFILILKSLKTAVYFKMSKYFYFPSDCSIWNLQWPTNRFLMGLKESFYLPSVPLMSVERSLGYTTIPTNKTFDQRVGSLFILFLRLTFLCIFCFNIEMYSCSCFFLPVTFRFLVGKRCPSLSDSIFWRR